MANDCHLSFFFLLAICMKWTKASLLLRIFHCCTQWLPWSLPLPWWHRREECMFAVNIFLSFSCSVFPSQTAIFSSLLPFSFSPLLPLSHFPIFFHAPFLPSFAHSPPLPSSSASASFSFQSHHHHHSLLPHRS